MIWGLAKDVSSYNESSLKQELLELARVVALIRNAVGSPSVGGDSAADLRTLRGSRRAAWEPRTYEGESGIPRVTEPVRA